MAVSVLFVILGCGFLKDKVEQKVSDEIDEQVKDSERKLDSIMESTNLDSLQQQLDSIMLEVNKTSKEIDKTTNEIDSLEKEINKRK